MHELILDYIPSVASLRSWVYMCYPEALVALGRLGNALKQKASKHLRNLILPINKCSSPMRCPDSTRSLLHQESSK